MHVHAASAMARLTGLAGNDAATRRVFGVAAGDLPLIRDSRFSYAHSMRWEFCRRSALHGKFRQIPEADHFGSEGGDER